MQELFEIQKALDEMKSVIDEFQSEADRIKLVIEQAPGVVAEGLRNHRRMYPEGKSARATAAYLKGYLMQNLPIQNAEVDVE